MTHFVGRRCEESRCEERSGVGGDKGVDVCKCYREISKSINAFCKIAGWKKRGVVVLRWGCITCWSRVEVPYYGQLYEIYYSAKCVALTLCDVILNLSVLVSKVIYLPVWAHCTWRIVCNLNFSKILCIRTFRQIVPHINSGMEAFWMSERIQSWAWVGKKVIQSRELVIWVLCVCANFLDGDINPRQIATFAEFYFPQVFSWRCIYDNLYMNA